MKHATTCFKFVLVIAGGLVCTSPLAQELEEEGEQLAPLYTSTIEFGLGYSSEDSFKFGEYNGLEDEGVFAIGNIDIRRHSVIGDSIGDYWALSGTNLGLDPRTIYGEYSHDGTYGKYGSDSGYSIYFEYDQIPHNQFDDGSTPFIGAGTNTQTLPANWVGASSTSGMTTLLSNLKPVAIETERQRYGSGATWDINDNWSVQGHYRHEIKEGSDPIGAIFGSSGGNPRGSVIARSIDYDVDEFAASLTYNNGSYQHILSYTLSLFDNNNTALRFANPFNLAAWAAGSNFSNGAVGQMGYEPDNEAYTFNYSTGYNFNPTTRFTGNITYGEMTQDDAFLPYSSIHPAVVPLPMSNLDGEIDTLHANVNLFTRYGRNLDLRARYTYDDRDNNTPQEVYLRIPGDAALQGTIDGSNARVNWPYSSTAHKVELDGGYRISPTTKLSAGYVYETKDRDFSEVSSTDEHTFKVKLSAAPMDTVDGWVKYQHSIRDGSAYISNQPLLTGHSEEHILDELADDPSGDSLFENDPLMRKFYMADRDRDQISANLSFYPTDTLAFTVTGAYNNDDYDETQIGVQEADNFNVSLDASYNPNDNIGMYAYYTHEAYDYMQRGFRRDGDTLGPNTSRYLETNEDFWTVDTDDKVNTVGAGLDWNVIEDKFKLILDGSFSRAYSHYTPFSGPALTGGNVADPFQNDVTTRIASVRLTGDYQAKENLIIRFRYMYERFASTDIALDNADSDTLANVILLGNQADNYNGHVIGVTLIYGFQH